MPTEEEKNVFLESLKNGETSEKQTDDALVTKKKKKLSGTALFATLFLLFLLVITLLIFVISIGGAQNPILQSFGIQSGEVKQFLLGLNNWTFGTLSILLLILFAIGLFRGISAPKEEKDKRKSSLVFGLVSGLLIFAVVAAWLGMFAFINSLPASAIGAQSGIEIVNIPAGERIVAPVTISLSAASIEREIEARGQRIRRFAWDKESDGNYEVDSGFNPRVDLIFREEGRQVVSLLVELEGAEPLQFSTTFQIDAVVFDAVPVKGEVPLTVQFDARDVIQQLAAKTFEWDFDNDGIYDDTTASPRISHTFEKIGIFPVQLRVILQDDQVKRFTRDITVTGAVNDRIRAIISADPLQGPAPLTVSFSADDSFSSEGEIVTYDWNFGDGSQRERGMQVEHVFEEPGSYRVELTVEDSTLLLGAVIADITVQEPVSIPSIVLQTEPAFNEKNQIIANSTPLKVTFDAFQSTDPDNDIVAFEWDFDTDGQTDETGAEAAHTFYTAGEFPVTLTVTDAEGNAATLVMTVITKEDPVTAVIMANPETGSVPLTITFDGSNSTCGENCRILSYQWDFKDGTPPQLTGAHTAHTFRQVGTYPVSLTITTESGKTASSTKIVAVRVPPLKACFEASRSSGTAPLAVSFTDCSAGTIQNWKWDFGDGVISYDRTPEHIFEKAGEYTVILSVTDKDNTTSQTSQKILVQ